LSIDGPEDLHDHYRVDKNQQPTFKKVFAASRLLRKHGIQFNTLTVVNRINAIHPLEVYRFLKDEVRSTRIQFIPLVEPKVFTETAPQYWCEKMLPSLGSSASRPGNTDSFVTDWSVDPQDYGNFLCKIFDEWYKRDIGKIFIYLFECALGQWMGMESSLCIMADICGKALAIEHDGSVYSCDHYVYPEYRIGNIKKRPLSKMVFSARQFTFGTFKSKSLPDYCHRCSYLFACNGECPRNRFLRTTDGEVGLNYLCSGLRKYFAHVDPYMKLMARRIRKSG
jgi:uncharacterized protein